MANQNLTPIIKESFSQYSGAVLQSRALVDVRDCMKPSARQIFYCMETDKFTADKPFKKTLKAIGSAMRMYIHGDASCEGVIMRAGQPFAMRYPLVEVEGSYGTLVETGNWAAPRYTASRLSKIAENLFTDLDKDTIKDWRDNYDDTEKYPAVLPSKGYYNICNGTFGIGIGMGSSIPQFNIKDVNKALELLLTNPAVSDDEIICMPDFATGGIMINPAEVREALKNGGGKACQLRAKIHYDAKDNCLIVTEIPFGVYTNTICGELEAMLTNEEVDNPGIERFNDLTGKEPLIKIYLNKKANQNKVLAWLYKNTSLQYWYAINFTMLDNGKFPKQFTWREALQSHIEHEKQVYRFAFEFDRQKALHRKHIIEGLLIAIANIDEVIKIVKNSKSTADASVALCNNFLLDEEQAKAILDMKVSRLAHLEVEKLEKEKIDLERTIARIEQILADEKLFNNELVKGWREVAVKYGDARRTEIIAETVYKEVVEIKDITVENILLDDNTVLCVEPNLRYHVGAKANPWNKRIPQFAWKGSTAVTNYLITQSGLMYRFNANEDSINSIIPTDIKEQIIGVVPALDKKYFITASKGGKIKKCLTTDVSAVKNGTAIAKLKDDDTLVFAGVAEEDDYLLLLSEKDTIVKLQVKDLTTTGRATIGCKGIDGTCVAAAIGSSTDKVFMVSNNCGKYTTIEDFTLNARGSKGQQVAENTTLIKICTFPLYHCVDKKVVAYNDKSFAIKGKNSAGAKI